MTFRCDGCQKMHRDKDLGSLVKYENNGNSGQLLFCAPIAQGEDFDNDCFDPTVFYLGERMTPEQRRNVRNVVVEIMQAPFMIPKNVLEYENFDDLWLDECDALAKHPLDAHLEKGGYAQPLEHYQRRTDELLRRFS